MSVASNEFLREKYESGLSAREVGELCGMSANGVQYRLRQMGVPMRGRHYGRWKPKPCVVCSAEYTPNGPASRYCSPACQHGTAGCESCGSIFVKRPLQGAKSPNDNRFCGVTCRWKAAKTRDEYGRYLSTEGYVVLDKRWSSRPPTRGLNDNGYVRLNLRKDGRVLEHRHVMQQVLGRPLLPDETVHHINGTKTDNRPENLELWASKHPRGQRVQDLVEFAVEILGRYAPDRLTAEGA